MTTWTRNRAKNEEKHKFQAKSKINTNFENKNKALEEQKIENEQEEDSRKILIKLKDNIAELLEYYYKTKNPFKPQKETKNI